MNKQTSRTQSLTKVMSTSRPFKFRLAMVAMMDTDKGRMWPTPTKRGKGR